LLLFLCSFCRSLYANELVCVWRKSSEATLLFGNNCRFTASSHHILYSTILHTLFKMLFIFELLMEFLATLVPWTPHTFPELNTLASKLSARGRKRERVRNNNLNVSFGGSQNMICIQVYKSLETHKPLSHVCALALQTYTRAKWGIGIFNKYIDKIQGCG
jgi:hypothetical protein